MSRDRADISFVLEQAIVANIQNPPQPKFNASAKVLGADDKLTGEEAVEQSLDFIAYHDSIQLLHDVFADKQGVLKHLNHKEFITQEMLDQQPNCIYAIDFNEHVIQPEDNAIKIANHHRFVLTRYVKPNEFKSGYSRITGTINCNNNTDKLFENKDCIVIQPFEITTIVNPKLIKGIEIKDAYKQNPLHPCFQHILNASPVMGVCLEKTISQMIGYVVHAKMLYNLTNDSNMESKTPHNNNFKLKDLISLQHDTQSALKLLKHRYCMDVDEDKIQMLTDFDDKLKEFSEGACCIEFPNL